MNEKTTVQTSWYIWPLSKQSTLSHDFTPCFKSYIRNGLHTRHAKQLLNWYRYQPCTQPGTDSCQGCILKTFYANLGKKKYIEKHRGVDTLMTQINSHRKDSLQMRLLHQTMCAILTTKVDSGHLINMKIC